MLANGPGPETSTTKPEPSRPERVLEPLEQRREQQLAVVADEVRNAHQADDAGVSAQGNGGGRGKAGGVGGIHGGIVVSGQGFRNATE